MDLPIDTYLDKRAALQFLSTHLYQGSLCLFLGSGVSLSSDGSFPTWTSLVKDCVESVSLSTDDINDSTPIDTLLNLMERVQDKCSTKEEYKSIVKQHLNKYFKQDYSHAQNMLLIAINAITRASRRGAIKEIITYNFDDYLEWYLSIHGTDIQIISELPYLHRDCDLHIFHPHGFLPKTDFFKDAEHFVFDSYSYDLTVGNENFPWYPLCQQLLLKKIAIMIGLSGDDPSVKTLVARTNSALCSNRPVAFLLNKTSEIKNDTKWYTKRGIIPIGFDDYDSIWLFLLKICQVASESTFH